MTRYYRVTADYNPIRENHPTYEYRTVDSVTKGKMKKWFQNTFNLKVYSVEEISENEWSGSGWKGTAHTCK